MVEGTSTVERRVSAESVRREVVKYLEDHRLVYHEDGGKDRLSPKYPDIKRVWGNAELSARIADWAVDNIPENVTCIAARGDGGIPFAAMIAQRALLKGRKLDVTYIRYENRRHGTPNEVDGHVPNSNDVIILVDDILATGRSLTKMDTEVLNRVTAPFKANIVGGLVVAKRGEGKADTDGLPVKWLFDSSALSDPDRTHLRR